jgi:hypothetical protein
MSPERIPVLAVPPDVSPGFLSPDVATQLVPHGASIGAIIGALMGWLPAFIALIPAAYYGILIYESKTVQGWLHRRFERKSRKRIAKLRAKAKVVSAQLEAAEMVRSAKVEAVDKVAVAVADAKQLVTNTAVQTAVEQAQTPVSQSLEKH